jgi:hypothetical protein
MGLRLWDYGCGCGKEYRGYPVTAQKTPKTIKCECGQRASWIMAKTNGISDTPYGRFDPQFGCVVESYAHKNQLLKQHGMVEVGGPEHMDDIMNDGQAASEPNPDIIKAESMEEILKNIPQDRVDRKSTGNPDRPMLDCWTEL